ncbi:uncharacterized protein MONBRDRAFT_27729 [Monosiga brevicollis MX1]|uniref:Uncharacterized protein n=1 Tax=Monosiga brevicollis TaxID=81824 RepID=A9V652_MONBE|nr:uncharacterized protein MONBRDRAFT_27729 [Monosiga brevicollis MX1]EDQ87009.1 predicted protein [Monosiga brevicollis MX1]|eukprot:XP_001748248.1 hypothetical protein [Monosiga brevicollis MX1]
MDKGFKLAWLLALALMMPMAFAKSSSVDQSTKAKAASKLGGNGDIIDYMASLGQPGLEAIHKLVHSTSTTKIDRHERAKDQMRQLKYASHFQHGVTGDRISAVESLKASIEAKVPDASLHEAFTRAIELTMTHFEGSIRDQDFVFNSPDGSLHMMILRWSTGPAGTTFAYNFGLFKMDFKLQNDRIFKTVQKSNFFRSKSYVTMEELAPSLDLETTLAFAAFAVDAHLHLEKQANSDMDPLRMLAARYENHPMILGAHSGRAMQEL